MSRSRVDFENLRKARDIALPKPPIARFAAPIRVHDLALRLLSVGNMTMRHRVARTGLAIALCTGAASACSAGKAPGSSLRPVDTSSGAGGSAAAGGSLGSAGGVPGNDAGGSLDLLPPSEAGTDSDAGPDQDAGNGATQCNGRFTGHLRDFSTAQDPSGAQLDPSALPPVA